MLHIGKRGAMFRAVPALFGLPMRVVLLLTCLLLSPLSRAVELRDVRLWDGPESTRIVFDLIGGTEHKFFTLENPDRVVIDIAGASKAPGLALDSLSRGVVKSVRTGPREGGLRVVLDLNTAVSSKSFGMEPNGNYGHRLIFDLFPKTPAPVTEDETVVAAMEPSPAPAVVGPARKETVEVSVPKVEVRTEAKPELKPEVRKAAPVVKPIVIAIDAGHGGEDPGARGRSTGMWEKDVTLRIAKRLAGIVNATPGYKAVLTRTGDYFIPLRGRTAIARKADRKSTRLNSSHNPASRMPSSA
jgi:N-acetylmuramoyl-L-alanine amidase